MRRTIALGAVVLASLAAAGPPPAATTGGELRAVTEEIFPRLVEARRWFHRHPELSNREEATGREIARRLRDLGLEVTEEVAGHGVVGVLRGDRPGPVVAWRSDIDALPITEQVDVPYRSERAGVMHACGHDVHITIGLGAAEVLSRLKGDLAGTVKFIFQPAEEGAPAGEPGGAPLMIAEGVLENPAPRAIFGLHVMPTLRAGQVGVRPGGIMAAADTVRITIRGRMSHGSAPHDGIDAVYVASQAVVALQAIAARQVDARRPVVVSIGSLTAGNRHNIVADTAVLEGTVRTLDEPTHARVPELMDRILAGICAAYGATYELEYDRSNPVTFNDEKLSAFAISTLRGVLGEGVVDTEPIMAAEDFAYYGKAIPAFYFHLGVGNPEKGWTSYVHTPTFRPDEEALKTGVEAAATLLRQYLTANR